MVTCAHTDPLELSTSRSARFSRWLLSQIAGMFQRVLRSSDIAPASRYSAVMVLSICRERSDFLGSGDPDKGDSRLYFPGNAIPIVLSNDRGTDHDALDHVALRCGRIQRSCRRHSSHCPLAPVLPCVPRAIPRLKHPVSYLSLLQPSAHLDACAEWLLGCYRIWLINSPFTKC